MRPDPPVGSRGRPFSAAALLPRKSTAGIVRASPAPNHFISRAPFFRIVHRMPAQKFHAPQQIFSVDKTCVNVRINCGSLCANSVSNYLTPTVAYGFPLFTQFATRRHLINSRLNKGDKIFSTFPHRSSSQQGFIRFYFRTSLALIVIGRCLCKFQNGNQQRPQLLPQILKFPQRETLNHTRFRFVLSPKASTVRQQSYNS